MKIKVGDLGNYYFSWVNFINRSAATLCEKDFASGNLCRKASLKNSEILKELLTNN